jgi:DNA-binding CsgD family transcriptional regulator
VADIYVRITNEPVHRTSCHSDNTVNVDLDSNGVPVGVEVIGALSVTVDGHEVTARTPAHDGEGELSHHEVDVVHDLAAGLTVRQIARKYDRTQSAISMRLTRLSLRLGTHTATQTVVECLARGWVRLERPIPTPVGGD